MSIEVNRDETDPVFSDSQYCCVLYADMVDSTRISASIGASFKLRLFYRTFILKLSDVARSFGAQVIKTAGDSIICCFPKTCDNNERQCFQNVLDCGIAMIHARCAINSTLVREGLPTTNYRVSADYGKHEVVRAADSSIRDLFGTTMNVCSKINSLAAPNSMIIGGDLYQLTPLCEGYSFQCIGEYCLGLRNAYPVYSVSSKKKMVLTNNLRTGAYSESRIVINV